MRIGIDLGGTKTEGVVMDAGGAIVARERRPTPAAAGYDAILTDIAELVAHLERQAARTCRVGIGTPGALTQTGLLKNSNTVCLNGRPLLRDLERKPARPVRLANDANCFALSEAQDGAAQGHGVVFGVIMGTGVGGGVVFHGRLHEGPHHIAGEWGHNILETDGPPCYCGRRGCVETLISGPGLARDYGGGATAADIVARAATGEARAQAALARFMERFGRALATVINILDPDCIVLGGGLSNMTALYTDGRAAVARHVFNNEAFATPIVPNVHGDSSGVRGAAQLWPPE